MIDRSYQKQFCIDASLWCDFCNTNHIAIDDCGPFSLHPDRDIKYERLACWDCLDGEPGKKHRERYGQGER